MFIATAGGSKNVSTTSYTIDTSISTTVQYLSYFIQIYLKLFTLRQKNYIHTHIWPLALSGEISMAGIYTVKKYIFS